MSKVPVGGSIAHAYTFVFGRFFQIIGTAWLPALLYGLGTYVFLKNMQPWPDIRHGADPMLLVQAACFGLGVALFGLAIRAVLGISLTQEAFGVRKDLTLAHFVVGPRELRLFFGLLRFTVLFVLLYIVVLALCAGALFAAHKYGAALLPQFKLQGHSVASVAAALFCIVIAVWFALSMLRLAFILPAVASVEHRTRLARAWHITHGSGWRIVLVCVLAFLPIMIAAGVAAYYLVGAKDVAGLMAAMHPMKPANHVLLAQFYANHAAAFAFLAGILTIVNSAILAGASAHAYRAVTGHEDPEPEDDAALVAPLLEPVMADEPAAHEEEPLPVAPADHGHGVQEETGHGHEDHGHAHEDHGHGAQDETAHADHGHGGEETHAVADGHHGHVEAHGHAVAVEEAASDDRGGESHGTPAQSDHGHGVHAHDGLGDDGHAHHAAAHAEAPLELGAADAEAPVAYAQADHAGHGGEPPAEDRAA